jgi:hypothetical protein
MENSLELEKLSLTALDQGSLHNVYGGSWPELKAGAVATLLGAFGPTLITGLALYGAYTAGYEACTCK